MLSSTLAFALASDPLWRAGGAITYYYLSFKKAHVSEFHDGPSLSPD